ncbi:MAG: FtsW/RodA/SpoVE family cell cycle protein [Clostridia bacterium]|nr:FtsW/RodA/SpoVE family cell cycle protein [Clostridia bacterium]
MKEFVLSTKEKISRLDPVILVCVLLLNAMSIFILSSLSGSLAAGSWYLRSQIIASAVSILFMFVLSFMDYDAVFEKLKYFLFAASIILIIVVKIWGKGSYGNNNWISFGNVSVQPTEFVKITFMITFAIHLGKVKEKLNRPLQLLLLLLHGGLIVGLVLWQGDTGMALIYLFIMLVMLFSAGLSLWYLLGFTAVGVIATPLIWTHLTEAQQMRILAGFNPDMDPLDKGYQAIHSRNAIISGGFRGAGFSGGTQYKTVFAPQSDFIFSVLAEKFGFIGTILYVIIIFVLVLRILWISRQTRKKYASYICVGVAGMIIAQTIINIGMCLAIMPVIGVTLPFLSYGPSSLLSMYMAIGVVQSICVYNKKYYFERENE